MSALVTLTHPSVLLEGSGMRKSLAASLASPIIVLSAMAGIGPAQASPGHPAGNSSALAPRIVPYSVDSHGTYFYQDATPGYGHSYACMILKNDSFTLNQPIDVTGYSNNCGTFSGSGWYIVSQGNVCDGSKACGDQAWPFSNSSLDSYWNGYPVFEVEKAKGSSGAFEGCLGSNGGSVVLRWCSGAGSSGTLWVWNRNNRWINVQDSNNNSGGNGNNSWELEFKQWTWPEPLWTANPNIGNNGWITSTTP